MAFESELIAAMGNHELARAWLAARRWHEIWFLNFRAVVAACEKNDELDVEAERLAAMLIVAAKELGHLRACMFRAKCGAFFFLGCVGISAQSFALTVLK